MPYSGFFRRAVAFLLDMFLVTLPPALIFGPILALQTLTVGSPATITTAQAGLLGITIFSWQLVTLLLSWLYFALLESSAKQSTWGKRLLGIKVVGAEGGRIGFGRATARFFCKILSYLLFYIGFIMAAFTNRKRALHDMIVETYVVKKEFEPGQELPATKSHWIGLIGVSVIWVLLLISSTWLAARSSMTPTQLAAQNAANRLSYYTLSDSAFSAPIRDQGTTYFYTEDGYRAVVVDPVSNNKFTLFRQNGTTQACCEAFPFGDCATTGFAECE